MFSQHFIILIFTLTYLSCLSNVNGQRLKELMYENIDGAFACFRRLNGTHQFGCTSARSGNVGVIHIIESQSDVDWLVKDSLAPPYVAVVHPSMFTKSLLLSLQSSGKVNGVAVINNGSAERPESFSHEDSCPNRYSGLSLRQGQTCGVQEQKVWNPSGTSILLMDWNFPIFYVTEQSHINRLYDCHQTHNVVPHPADQLDRSLCALELRSHMYASVNSKKCIQRNSYKTLFSQMSFCDPLGGKNVWQTLFPRSTLKESSVKSDKQVESNGSIAVLAARLDANSMFDGLVPSSVGAVTSIVTLIATAELLHKMIPPSESYENNVLFLLLSGESYDYIGSSRIVYDMKHGVFPVIPDPSVAQPPPIGLHHIGPFIELSQLNKPPLGHPLHIHRLNASSETDKLISYLKRNGQYWDIQFKDLPPSKNLPPASLQTFLAEKPDIPGIIVTEHAMQYSNQFYHSVLDDINNIKFKYSNGSRVADDSIQLYLRNLTNTLAHTLYEHVTGKPYVGAAIADLSLMDELLYCYLEQSNCTLFQSAGNTISPAKPLSYYVGVKHVPGLVPVLSGSVLALLTGTQTSFNETHCHNNVSTDQVYQYIWANSKWNDSASPKVCLQTTMNFSDAVSPAFVIEGYNMTSGQYSTWTESVWPELTAKLFVKPSFRHELMTLSLGVTVLVLSFAGVLFIKVRKEILFSPG
ncbi:Nicastrin [Frankliniella fusca]|uniref:Nicastrin n=1 Tax=Frankliniella fusca TaxID=407009 RepID=A0AAE1H0D8_9NEOP|nr:Nicastrin [Frankliniella fusca]